MPTKLTSVEIQKFKDALSEIGKDPLKVDPEAEAEIINTLTEKRGQIFSNSEAINRILSQPRINPVTLPTAAGYSDSGYNDVQDPQPGGGYRDYSQFIDRDTPDARGYNDIQDPDPGGGYRDYSQFIDRRADSGIQGYNDGPQDPLSTELAELFTKNFSLKEKLRKEGLLSDYLSAMLDASRRGAISNTDLGE